MKSVKKRKKKKKEKEKKERTRRFTIKQINLFQRQSLRFRNEKVPIYKKKFFVKPNFRERKKKKKKKKKLNVKMKHPTQVPPQMKNTLTPKLAAVIPTTPVELALTR